PAVSYLPCSLPTSITRPPEHHMRRHCVVLVAALLALPAAAAAQQNHDHGAHSAYAGISGRDIKALDSASVNNYLSGAGMGFALSAELNGYPGPRHVLDLADSLQ